MAHPGRKLALKSVAALALVIAALAAGGPAEAKPRKSAKQPVSAKVQASKAADAAGDEDLAGAIRDFASTWETRRGQILTAVEGLAASLRGVAENFETTDGELANALGEKR